MKIPMMGTQEKTATSRYQVSLRDKTDRSISPLDYPISHRFFDTIEERNTFVRLLETSITQAKGRLVHNPRQSHPLFAAFEVYDRHGRSNYGITVYV